MLINSFFKKFFSLFFIGMFISTLTSCSFSEEPDEDRIEGNWELRQLKGWVMKDGRKSTVDVELNSKSHTCTLQLNKDYSMYFYVRNVPYLQDRRVHGTYKLSGHRLLLLGDDGSRFEAQVVKFSTKSLLLEAQLVLEQETADQFLTFSFR